MPIPTTHEVAETTMAAPGTAIDAAYPDNMAIGNMIYGEVWGGGTFNLPDDWFLILAQGETTFGSGESRTFYHIVDGSEDPTVQFTWTDTMYGHAVLTRIEGQHATTPIDVFAGSAGPSTDNQVAPSVTTTVPDCLIIRSLSADRIAVSPVAPPSGHTEIWDFNGAVSFDASAAAGATIGQASAGASGTATFVMSSARPAALQTVAIAGAAGGEFQLGPADVTSQSEISGSLSVKNGLAGTVVSHSLLAGALSVKNGLVASLTSHSSIAGALSVKTGLAGIVASQSEIAATLSLKNGLAGVVLSRSSLVGSLSVKNGLVGSLTSRSVLAGVLSIGGFEGTLTSRSSIAGTLFVSAGLSGTLTSRSSIAGTLGLRNGLSAVLLSRSSLTGSLTTGSEIQFDDPSIHDLTPGLSLIDISPILRII